MKFDRFEVQLSHQEKTAFETARTLFINRSFVGVPPKKGEVILLKWGGWKAKAKVIAVCVITGMIDLRVQADTPKDRANRKRTEATA